MCCPDCQCVASCHLKKTCPAFTLPVVSSWLKINVFLTVLDVLGWSHSAKCKVCLVQRKICLVWRGDSWGGPNCSLPLPKEHYREDWARLFLRCPVTGQKAWGHKLQEELDVCGESSAALGQAPKGARISSLEDSKHSARWKPELPDLALGWALLGAQGWNRNFQRCLQTYTFVRFWEPYHSWCDQPCKSGLIIHI